MRPVRRFDNCACFALSLTPLIVPGYVRRHTGFGHTSATTRLREANDVGMDQTKDLVALLKESVEKNAPITLYFIDLACLTQLIAWSRKLAGLAIAPCTIRITPPWPAQLAQTVQPRGISQGKLS